MSEPAPLAKVVRFGPFEADAAARQLRKRGLRIRLRRQSFDVLAALLDQPGEVVTRQQLRQRLWPGRQFGEFEDNLNTAVQHLRSALGDSSDRPKYIETLPGIGYRFTGQAVADASPGIRNYRLLVLPFMNLSGDAAEDYVSDGLTEEVIGQLALLDPRLLVIARTTSMHYKGTRKPVAAIAEELNLDYLLEGSLRRSGERMRFAAQLIDARHETHVWANNFDGNLTDFVTFQCEMAQAVANEIRLPLVRPPAVAIAPAAFDLYLRGTCQHAKVTPPALLAAVDCFEAAIAIHPHYSRAWARLALAWAEMGFWTYAPGPVVFPKAEQAARRALEYDDTLPDAHRALGLVHWFYHWDLGGCEREYRRALQLNPGSATTRWGLFAFLASMRSDFAHAQEEADIAIQLDPHSVVMRSHVGWVHYWGRQFERAIAECRRALQMSPGCLAACYILGLAQLAQGRFAESIAAWETAVALHEDSYSLAHLASVCGLAGQRERAGLLLQRLNERAQSQPVPPSLLAVAYTGLGEHRLALDWLDKAIDGHDTHVLWLRIAPHWDPLRAEPRFADLLSRIVRCCKG